MKDDTVLEEQDPWITACPFFLEGYTLLQNQLSEIDIPAPAFLD